MGSWLCKFVFLLLLGKTLLFLNDFAQFTAGHGSSSLIKSCFSTSFGQNTLISQWFCPIYHRTRLLFLGEVSLFYFFWAKFSCFSTFLPNLPQNTAPLPWWSLSFLLLLGKILLFHNDFAQSASGHGWGRWHNFVSLLYLIFNCGSHPSHLLRYQLIYPVYDPK